jgi:hypothetical protein
LPQNISLVELHLPPGEHELELELNGWSKKATLQTRAGGIQMLWMMDAGASHSLKVLSIK